MILLVWPESHIQAEYAPPKEHETVEEEEVEREDIERHPTQVEETNTSRGKQHR